MLEETISAVSMWAAKSSWLTPAVLFVVLNIMIVTIAVTSGHGAGPKHPHNSTQNQDPTRKPSPPYSPCPLNRSPSVFQGLSSINFYRSDKEPTYNNPLHYSAYPIVPPDTDPVDLSARFETHMEGNAVHADEIPKEEEEQEVGGEEGREANEPSLDGVFSRIHEKKLPRWVKKSASEKAASSHFEVDEAAEEEEGKADVVVRQRVLAAADEEVDAKADDFINKFRQQLQLQRMSSLMSRGSGELAIE